MSRLRSPGSAREALPTEPRPASEGDGSAAPRSVHPLAAGALAVATAYVLLLAAVQIWYAQPLNDDFARAAVPLGDLPEYIGSRYECWTGRWSALGTIIVLTHVVDITRSYWACLVPLLAVEVAAVFLLLGARFREALGWRSRLAVTALFSACYWSAMPAPHASIHWLTGNIENQLGIALSMILLALLLRGRPRGVVGVLFLALLAFFLVGLHELFGLFTGLVLAVGTAVAWRVGSESRVRWALVLSAAALGLAIVCLAPGNGVRAALEDQGGGDLGRTLRLVRTGLLDIVLPWILDVRLVVLTALLVLHPAARRLQPSWLREGRVPWRLILPLTTLACVLAGLAAPVWAVGYGPVSRTLNGIYLVFLAGWFASAFAWTRPACREAVIPSRLERLLGSAAYVLLALGLLINPNVRLGTWDWEDRLAPWHDALDQRFELARGAAARGQTELRLPPGPRRPRCSTSEVLGSDPTATVNRQFARYFGLSAVRVGEEE